MSLIQGIDPNSLLQGGWPLALGWLKSAHLNTLTTIFVVINFQLGPSVPEYGAPR